LHYKPASHKVVFQLFTFLLFANVSNSGKIQRYIYKTVVG